MINLMEIEPNAVVVEIGVGSGLLTSLLSSQVKYIYGYELDQSLQSVIEQNLLNINNIEIIYDDFLNRNLEADLKLAGPLYIIGNIPYYITTPIIMKIISSKLDFKKIILMVQAEVGERILAKVGTKRYNSLTIFLNYYYDIKELIKIKKELFIPRPTVNSVLLEFKPKLKPYEVKDETLFLKLVRDSFQFKRKTLKNNLSNYNLNIILKVLTKFNLDLTVRAEKLTIEQFIEIANALKENDEKTQ